MHFLSAILFLAFAWRRLLTYLHIFQQEEYDGPRFVNWLVSKAAVDKRVSVAALVIGILAFLIKAPWMAIAAPVLLSIVFVGAFLIEKDPTKSAKKKLVLTARAKRILYVAAGVVVLAAAAVAFVNPPIIAWIVPVQLIPFALPLAVLLTDPYEKSVQKKFWDEAHEKLVSLNTSVIAITGSFGKTTVKHILGHILETNAQVLMTPGSVNTPMGIARIVREQLGAHHKFFICEMGAYGPGSIERLCRLAPPTIGVITAIGPAHYERFKSLEAVARTKFELADAVIAPGGKAIVNSAVLGYDYPKKAIAEHGASFTTVGSRAEDEFRLLSQEQTPDGTKIILEQGGETFEIVAPVFGDHQALNIAIAFAAACAAGVAPDRIIRALKTTPQTAHRLEVKRQANGVTIIDDAYNSNPVGFASAIKMLSILRTDPAGRRILVTPGMVELGEAHDAEHEKIGALAASDVDIMLAVRPERIEALTRAFLKGRPADALVRCQSFAEASQWMEKNCRNGDVVLLENDLPDLYERKLSL